MNTKTRLLRQVQTALMDTLNFFDNSGRVWDNMDNTVIIHKCNKADIRCSFYIWVLVNGHKFSLPAINSKTNLRRTLRNTADTILTVIDEA